MTFGFLSGSRNFCKLLWVSCEVFVVHGYDWIHWVAKSCTTTAYRWLFRDSQFSLRTFWSAVIKSPNFFARGTALPIRLLHLAPVILVRLQISQFRSLGKWEKTLCLPKTSRLLNIGSEDTSCEELAWESPCTLSFRKLLSVSWAKFVLHGYDCDHWVAKSCTTTEHRWLYRDPHPSLSCDQLKKNLKFFWPEVLNSQFAFCKELWKVGSACRPRNFGQTFRIWVMRISAAVGMSAISRFSAKFSSHSGISSPLQFPATPLLRYSAVVHDLAHLPGVMR